MATALIRRSVVCVHYGATPNYLTMLLLKRSRKEGRHDNQLGSIWDEE